MKNHGQPPSLHNLLYDPGPYFITSSSVETTITCMSEYYNT